MNRILAICLFLLAPAFLLPAASDAATCTGQAGTFLWSSVGGATTPASGWSCGVGAATDDYVVPSGSTIIITGNISLTTGSMTVSGGTLRVSPAVTFSPGVKLVQTSGLFEAIGNKVYEGRITSFTPQAFATGDTVTLSQDVSGMAAAGDYLVFGDDDAPTAGTAISGSVQVGPGPPTPGVYRPSYNKWAWYKITNVSTNAITYLEDETGQTGYTLSGTPFAGTRGPGAAGATATAANVTRGYMGHFTDLCVTDGTGSTTVPAANNPVLTTGDLGAQYVEVVTPTACAGRIGKILHTINNGISTCNGTQTAGDHLYVAGDLTAPVPGSGAACMVATSTFKIHRGARVGDKVRIVKPAVIDGYVSAAPTSYVVLSGGTFHLREARVIRLKPTALASPTAAMRGALFLIESAAGVQPISGSYMRDVDVAYFDHSVNQDEAAIFYGSASTYGPPGTTRYGTMMDMAGITLERLYVHDALTAQATGGLHIWGAGVKGTGAWKRLRAERVTDQSFSGYNVQLDTASTPSYGLTEGMLWENLPGTGRSAEGIKWVCYDLTKVGTCAAGGSFVRDVMVTGQAQGTVSNTDWGVSFDRDVFGGAFDNIEGPSFGLQSAGSGTIPNYVDSLYPNKVNNTLLTYFTPFVNLAKIRLDGDLTSSIVTGVLNSGDTSGSAIYGAHAITGSLVNASGYISAGSEILFWLNATTGPYAMDSFTLKDSVLHMAGASNAGKRLCVNYGNFAAMNSLTLDHLFIMGAGSENSTRGFMDDTSASNCGKAAASVSISNIIYAPVTPAYGIGANTNLGNGAGYSNIWQASTHDPATAAVCGTSASATCNVLASIFPTSASDGGLRMFVQRRLADVNDSYEQAKPRYLGFQSIGPAHALLGDFFLSQIENWSDKDLVKPATSGWLPASF